MNILTKWNGERGEEISLIGCAMCIEGSENALTKGKYYALHDLKNGRGHFLAYLLDNGKHGSKMYESAWECFDKNTLKPISDFLQETSF